MHAAAVLAARRLSVQQIALHAFTTPREVVTWLGAVQAQDYAAARWAVGVRLPNEAATDASIEDAVAVGAVIRTHALRGTWQLLAPADVRWMLALVTPRLVARSATRHRQLGLDAAAFRRSHRALEKALRDGNHLTRDELAAELRSAGIFTADQRLAHLLARAELDALICSGAPRGKQSTYALLDNRAPKPPAPLARDEALAKLARCYFRSRGPATIGDFTWWSGLTASDARNGLESVKSTLVSDVVEGHTYWRTCEPHTTIPSTIAYLLPAFDEYLVAYRNRDAVLDPKHVKRLNAGGGMLDPCVVFDSHVIGTWRRVFVRTTVAIEIDLFKTPTSRELRAILVAAERYGSFLGLEVTCVWRIADFFGKSVIRHTQAERR
jgi:Winged helix DNA-binding domain